METNATELRRNLFQRMDRALQGELVEIKWRASKLRLAAPEGRSKLSRAVRRHALQVHPDSIVESILNRSPDCAREGNGTIARCEHHVSLTGSPVVHESLNLKWEWDPSIA
jgi:hypothetical protein